MSRLERLGAIIDPTQAIEFFAMRLAGPEQEQFRVLFLDTRRRSIAIEALARGTVDGAEVHPREVVKAALDKTQPQ